MLAAALIALGLVLLTIAVALYRAMGASFGPAPHEQDEGEESLS